MTEVTYMEAARVLEVGARQVRDVLRQYHEFCPPIRYGYRTVRFDLDGVLKVKHERRVVSTLGTAKPRRSRRSRRAVPV